MGYDRLWVVDMTTRDEIYKHFGPLLVEAIVLITMEEINILRVKAELSKRTHSQLMNTLKNKLSQLDEYDWMKMLGK